ncbi:hypothetical protein ACSMXN_09410 [Jatrophihabitans sp. DSM 45814]
MTAGMDAGGWIVVLAALLLAAVAALYVLCPPFRRWVDDENPNLTSNSERPPAATDGRSDHLER